MTRVIPSSVMEEDGGTSRRIIHPPSADIAADDIVVGCGLLWDSAGQQLSRLKSKAEQTKEQG